MSTAFTARHRLRFAHCDPAGIAYYPRYLELCDAVIEEWTEQIVGVPRRRLHFELRWGLPTVDLRARFVSASRLGDWLDFSLVTRALGRSSIQLAIDATCAGEHRFAVEYDQVLIDMTEMKSIPWPDDWRERIAETMR